MQRSHRKGLVTLSVRRAIFHSLYANSLFSECLTPQISQRCCPGRAGLSQSLHFRIFAWYHI